MTNLVFTLFFFYSYVHWNLWREKYICKTWNTFCIHHERKNSSKFVLEFTLQLRYYAIDYWMMTRTIYDTYMTVLHRVYCLRFAQACREWFPSRGSGVHLTDASTSGPSPVSEISAMKRGLTSISTPAIAAARLMDSSGAKVARDKLFTTYHSH